MLIFIFCTFVHGLFITLTLLTVLESIISVVAIIMLLPRDKNSENIEKNNERSKTRIELWPHSYANAADIE